MRCRSGGSSERSGMGFFFGTLLVKRSNYNTFEDYCAHTVGTSCNLNIAELELWIDGLNSADCGPLKQHVPGSPVRPVRSPPSPDFLGKPAPRLRRRGVDHRDGVLNGHVA